MTVRVTIEEFQLSKVKSYMVIDAINGTHAPLVWTVHSNASVPLPSGGFHKLPTLISKSTSGEFYTLLYRYLTML